MDTENTYSRFVAGMKILLPLGALAILSSVVFIAQESDEARELPLAIGEDAAFTRERIGQPQYLSVLSDGATLQVTAEIVEPVKEGDTTYLAQTVVAQIEAPAGRIIDVTAPRGRVDTAAATAELLGEVLVVTSDGYRVETVDLFTRPKTGYAESGGAISGFAPFGRLDAGRMVFGTEGELGLEPLAEVAAEPAPRLLHFTGGVKVIYAPAD